MSDYTVVNKEWLEAELSQIAGAIRNKTGKTGTLEFPDGFKKAILNIPDIRVESDTLELTSEPIPNSSALQRYHIDCPPGAKIFVLAPTETTEEEIKNKAYDNAIAYYALDIKCDFTNITGTESNKAYQGVVTAWIVQSSGGRRAAGGITADNTNGVDFDTYRLAVGTYVWKAYYWDE